MTVMQEAHCPRELQMNVMIFMLRVWDLLMSSINVVHKCMNNYTRTADRPLTGIDGPQASSQGYMCVVDAFSCRYGYCACPLQVSPKIALL